MRLIAVFGLAAASLAWGQATFEGQIDLSNAGDSNHLSVHWKGPGPSGKDHRADVSADGSFQFAAKPGEYTLRVVDDSGREILSHQVEVGSGGGAATLSIPSPYRQIGTPAIVSVADLAHRPRPAALRACVRAERYTSEHDYQDAAAELEKAVAADALFARAHGNLGAAYAHLRRWNDAAFELRRAIELDPNTGAYYSNLGWVLSQQGRMPEAEVFAQKGARLDTTNPKSQLLLGWLLAKQPETRASAIPHLIFAARDIPQAHWMLADVYHLTGRELLAEDEMRQYAAACQDGAEPGNKRE
ncbi:MAG TPA: tetratricopeptide repeat protein [Bryobacteraceae bacterium]|nr:tetratricopeptide repeat protein [Bryobacteraceae bacterium]